MSLFLDTQMSGANVIGAKHSRFVLGSVGLARERSTKTME